MILNPRKVMVIYNTSDTTGDSQSVAEYYATARNMDSTHVQGYALGTTNTIPYASAAAFRAGALTDIQTYIDANAIEGVVLSINCPQKIELTNSYSGDQAWIDENSLCKVIGNCWNVVANINANAQISVGRASFLVDQVNGSNLSTNTTWARVFPAKGLSYTDTRIAPYTGTPVQDWRNAEQIGTYKTVPCGRLGLPTGSFTDSLTTAERCIDDAIWWEQNRTPSQETMLFGFSTRYSGSRLEVMCHGAIYDAYRRVLGSIGTIEVYDGNNNNFAAAEYAAHDYSFSLPSITIQDQATWLTGGGPDKELWGWVGTGAENIGSQWTGSATFARGGWMFESTSTFVSQYCISQGGCAAVGPVSEPSANGLPVIGGMVDLLVRGYSLMEAEMCSTYVSNGTGYERYTEACGDPLYSPLTKVGYGMRSAVVSSDII